MLVVMRNAFSTKRQNSQHDKSHRQPRGPRIEAVLEDKRPRVERQQPFGGGRDDHRQCRGAADLDQLAARADLIEQEAGSSTPTQMMMKNAIPWLSASVASMACIVEMPSAVRWS